MNLKCDWCKDAAAWIVRSLEAPGAGPWRAACRPHLDASVLDALHDSGVKPFTTGMAAIEVTLVSAPLPPRLPLPPAAVTPEMAG